MLRIGLNHCIETVALKQTLSEVLLDELAQLALGLGTDQ